MVKASSVLILISLIAGLPSQANAGFFNDLVASVIGSNTSAAENADKNVVADDFVNNPQNISLPEPSINPDMKNVSDNSNVNIVDGGALMPEEDLQGTDSGVNSYVSSSDNIITYTVMEGDTLGKIASQFSISKNTILYANTDIKNNSLKVGQTLVILPVDGVSYTIKKGDTLASIAKAYKADITDISEYNDLSSDKDLKSGEKIIVPGGVVSKKAEVKTPKPEKISKIEIKTQTTSKEKTETVKQASSEDISSGHGITGGYIWPLPKGVGRVSQRLHDDNAYDFAAPKGTPIYAIEDGAVLIADGSGYNGGYGLYVVINFADGAQAIFGHMSNVATTAGEEVKKGDIIGYVGSTGRSTGNHVHIGFHGGKPNPYRNLPLNSNGL